MDKINKNLDLQKDDQLADFADQVINGNTKQNASPPTDELFGLEETILRLNSSLPPVSLDDAKVKQMHVRFKARIRREEQSVTSSFWQKWFSRESTPQLALAFAVLAVVIVAIVGAPSFGLTGSTSAGTAFTPGSIFLAIGMAAVFFILYWFARKR